MLVYAISSDRVFFRVNDNELDCRNCLSTQTLLAPATGASGGRKVEMDKLLLMYWMFSEG